jgi:ribonucleoside-diphosphate reductase alpha chain
MKLKERPFALESITTETPTPSGNLFTTMTFHNASPFEVFLNIGKGGHAEHALAEGIGRLCSLILRMEELGTTQDRLNAIVEQLSGIGGGDSVGFGINKVTSVPDAIAMVLRRSYEKDN